MCPVFLDLILRGIHLDDPDFLSLNVTLTKSVQNFILNTNRFDSIETNQSFPYSTLPPLLLQVGTNFALSKYTLSFLYVHTGWHLIIVFLRTAIPHLKFPVRFENIYVRVSIKKMIF